jgi:sporulation protein YlmC with PRC-barrel domain
MRSEEFRGQEMTSNELHLELLLGKQVLDSEGRAVGRIEEIRAQQQGNEWVIQEYLVGSAALLERLSAWKIGLGILKLLGARKVHAGYRIPWDQLDLSDPESPSLHCTHSDLKALNEQLEQAEQP